MQKNSTNKKLISGWGRNHFVEAYSISPNSVQNVQLYFLIVLLKVGF